MRDVIRPSLPRAGMNDRGAVGVLVGVLIASGVLFGMAAVVLDVGQIYTERAELQNGADAGSLAVAKACAAGVADCSSYTALDGAAGTHADDNAHDGASQVTLVCGYDADQPLDACPADTGTTDDRTDCPPLPASGKEFVDVHTMTLSEDRSSYILPPTFSHVLAGEPQDMTVGACARAMWGAPSAAKGLRLTVSACEWDNATEGGTKYWPAPPETVPAADAAEAEVTLVVQAGTGSTNNSPPPCEPGPAGQDAPGGFGWTDPDPDNPDGCDTYFEQDGTYEGDPGNNVPIPCKTVLEWAYTNYPAALILPIYVDKEPPGPSGSGTNTTYTLDQPAAFVITGYKLPGMTPAPSKLTGNLSCGFPGSACIHGYFTTGTTSGQFGGGSGMGVSVVKLTG